MACSGAWLKECPRCTELQKAFEQGRVDGLTGMRWPDISYWAERPRCRRSYEKGFVLGFTEGVIKRSLSA